MLKITITTLLVFILSLPQATFAALKDFTMGPVFANYGENAPIDAGLDNPVSQRFKVVFDISKQSEDAGVNRQFNSIARFINMHVRAGVAKENIDVAMVIHGKASFDLMNNKAHVGKFGKANGNTELIDLLSEFGVKIFLCGQSAQYHDINKVQLNKNVEISLSAMTANALLQQNGYTLNPF